MKAIDLLVKIANGEIKEGFRIKSKNGDIYEYKEGKDRFYNIEDPIYVYSLGDFTKLNDEIEIIEEETTYEQNFTGWQIIQNGKAVYSYGYDEPALKPVDIADVEKNIKEMLKEKPKKIEHVQHSSNDSQNVKKVKSKIDELVDVVNYLLEKEIEK